MTLPLSAVLGQPEAVLALQLAAIDPAVGGVLLRGPRGTAKSTMARGLAAWLDGAPFVELPLGADEDKLVGTLDLQAVLNDKTVRAERGLLARADGGVLYADEVNLLPDHLVDLLLDAAASGQVHVEREGVSQQHSAAFVLVGTMNPDEGELRPQLLDRFGLCVDLSTPRDLAVRSAVLRQQLNARDDASVIEAAFASSEASARDALAAARAQLQSVDCSAVLDTVAADCAASGVDGLRGDLAWLSAARAHAALQARNVVTDDDLAATRAMALRHRLPDAPLDPPPPSRKPPANQSTLDRPQSASAERESRASEQAAPADLNPLGSGGSGRARARMSLQGASRHQADGTSIAWARSFSRTAGALRSVSDLARRQRWRKQGGPWIVLLDCSASMLRDNALARTQGAVLQLLQTAYLQRRDVAVLRFAGEGVETLHALGRAPKNATEFVRIVRGGGGTPLAAGLRATHEIVQQLPHHQRDAQLWLFTDGQVGLAGLPTPGCAITLVDTGGNRTGSGRRLAEALDAIWQPLNALPQVAA